MQTDQGQDDGRCAVRAEAQPCVDGAACAQSRLVIRDERTPQGETIARDESSSGEWLKDYQSETYKLQSRGGKGAVIAYPIPLDSANPRVAFIDWFAFTLKPPESQTYLWVQKQLSLLGGLSAFTPNKSGRFGYSHSASIDEAGVMAWGGRNQRGTVYVSLSGKGCARILDWQQLYEWCTRYEAKITRVDLAHDDFTGETVSIEKLKTWWDAGEFNSGGRQPRAILQGDWWMQEKGRTVYFGNRESGKLLRVYEKGKQLDDVTSPWVRAELELHNKDRHIPLDVLTRPGAYLAGAYPCMRFLSTEQCRIKTTREAAKISYERSVEVLRQFGGKFLNVMVQVNGGDLGLVVKQLRREGVPKRLDPYSYQLRNDPALADALGDGGPGDAFVPR